MNDVISAIVGTVLGSGGIFGLAVYYMRRHFDKRILAKEKDNEKKTQIRARRMQIDDELHHSYGRLFYWVVRAIETEEHNGELKNAFMMLENAEQKKKDLDREIRAEYER